MPRTQAGHCGTDPGVSPRRGPASISTPRCGTPSLLTSCELCHNPSSLALVTQLLLDGSPNFGITDSQQCFLLLGRQVGLQEQPEVLVENPCPRKRKKLMGCAATGHQWEQRGQPRAAREEQGNKPPRPLQAQRSAVASPASPSEMALMFSKALWADLNGEKATSLTMLWNLPMFRMLSSTWNGPQGSGYQTGQPGTPTPQEGQHGAQQHIH